MDYTHLIKGKLSEKRPPNRRGNIVVAVFTVLVVGLALIIPDAILTYSPLLTRFTDAMASLIPSINHLTVLSTFPEVTRFFFSILWVTVPVQVLVFSKNVPGLFSVQHVRDKKLVVTLLYLSLVPAMVLFAAFLVGDIEGGVIDRRAIRTLGSSRIGLAGGGILLVGSTSIFLSSTVLWIRHIPQIYFNRPVIGEKYK